MLKISHRTQADAVAFRLPKFGPVAASGSGLLSQLSRHPRPAISLTSRRKSFHFQNFAV